MKLDRHAPMYRCVKFSSVSLPVMPAEKSFASLVVKPIIRALETWILEAIPTPDVMPFAVTQHRLELSGLEQPLRVAHLTDLHFGPAQRLPSVRAWVNATLEQKPDLSLITGDFLEYRKSLSGVSELCAELSRITAPLGVFGVLGNHDLYAVRFAHLELTEPLERAGIRILTNTGFQARDDLFVAGVDDLWNLGKHALVAFYHRADLRVCLRDVYHSCIGRDHAKFNDATANFH